MPIEVHNDYISEPVLYGFMKKYGWRYIPSLIFLLTSAYCQSLTPAYLGRVIDALGERLPERAAVYRLLCMMLIASVLVFVTRYIWRYFLNGNARNLEAYLRERLFSHFQRMSVSFYVERKTGDLMAYAINDINAIRMSLGPALAMGVNSVALTTIAVTNMAVGVNTRLALFVLVPAPFIIITMMLLGREVRKRFKRVQEAFAAISDRVQENITGLRVIKAYVQEEAEVRRFEELNQNSRDLNLRMVHVSASMTPAVDLFFGISFTVSLIYGGSLVRGGTISLGDFVAFNGYLLLIIQPVRMVSRIINVMSRGAASYRRYRDILGVPAEVLNGPDDAPDGINHSDLEVRSLSFQYSNDIRTALKDISFHVRPGKSVGILGRTGSGKTTLVNILLRLYNPPDGTVFIGGVDANRLSLNRLRENIGYVPQDNFLFSASVEDNIRFFNPEYAFERIEDAAREAAVYDNVMEFPERFATQVGERGMSLSGGQKQRICIARAILKKPSLLILDDSLSAVDTNTEAEILSSIRRQTERGGSAILIAHRISVLAECDEIIVLDSGEIIERGTHRELSGGEGLYSRIAYEQMSDSYEG